MGMGTERRSNLVQWRIWYTLQSSEDGYVDIEHRLEGVSSIIDALAFSLNWEQPYPSMKRLYTTTYHDYAVLKDLDMTDPRDNRPPYVACQAFRKRMRLFEDIIHDKLNVQDLDYVFAPPIASDHFVCFVLNLKNERYEYLTSSVKYPELKTTEAIMNSHTWGIE
ncbi:hypothetical protein LIER_10623 [Lithospermum erythrorhizon]|uniref:Ubiquitin-like protease family profile domain-containing protein n=1 Tax=Lithospermum erythrorhizon TaxID=34254 RepID=A0AAV3PM99_LITER